MSLPSKARRDPEAAMAWSGRNGRTKGRLLDAPTAVADSAPASYPKQAA